MNNDDPIWNPKTPDQAQVTVFHRRFGGTLSLVQQLEDLTPHLPVWARPLWKLFLGWFKPWYRRQQIGRTMNDVDRQTQKIAAAWVEADRTRLVETAYAKARLEHPDAHVEVVKMPEHPVDAIYIEHPPDPASKAQVALGFGSIEIRAPFER